MDKYRGAPSSWLLRNSEGFPDFLFTILTYSMLLLIAVSLLWMAFGVLSFVHAGSREASVLIQIMDSMKTGLISLAGVIFGLAGSYTVRRFKKDEHYLQKKQIDQQEEAPAATSSPDIHMVTAEEDI